MAIFEDERPNRTQCSLLELPVSLPPLAAPPAFWKNNSIIDLRPLSGGNQSIANGINNWGDVVGAAVNGATDPFPNIWPILFFNNSTEL